MKKKNGYTLAEVLITLTIVGVVAAIGVPMLNKAKPDRNRIMFLKAYDTLVESVANMANSTNLYNQIYSVILNNPDGSTTERMYDIRKHPFLDYSAPMAENYHNATFSGQNKFCNLLAESMNSMMTNACSAGGFNGQFNFTTTPPNMSWHVAPPAADLTAGPQNATINFAYTVTVDINGDAGQNTLFGTAKHPPDRYQFFVFSDGRVEPASAFGQVFINQRLHTQRRDSISTRRIDNPSENYADRTLADFENLDSSEPAGTHIYSLNVNSNDNADIQVLN